MSAGKFVSRSLAGTLLGGWALVTLLGVVVTGVNDKGTTPGEWAVKAPLAPKSLLLDVAERDGVLVTVGDRGHALVSRDRGATWSQGAVPTRALLTAVHMHDAKLGWAVGHDEVVLRTRDGGLSWERVKHDPDKERPLLDVWFADDRRGLAVGAYGTIFTTADGGDTWEPRQVNGDDDFHLNSIVPGKDGALYLAAEAGRLYRSDDGGATWQALPSPYEGSFFGLLPASDGTLFTFGLRGNMYRSADRGQTWQRIETGTVATLTSAIELSPGRIVVGGLGGTLLWIDGPGWTVRSQNLPDRKGIVAIAKGDDRSLLLFGEGGVQRQDITQ